MENDNQDVPKLRFPEFNDSWKRIKIHEITDSITKGTTPKNFSEEGINFIKVENIENNQIININSYIDVNTHNNELNRSILEKNDLLFSIAGTLGRTAKVTEDILPANTNQALAILKINDLNVINVDYVLTRLNCSDIDKYIFQNLSVGAQPNLNLKQVGNIEIKLPSKPEQDKIQNFINFIDKKIELLEKKHQLFKDFKNYSMQRIFTSELRCAEFDEKWDWLNFKDIFKIISTKKYQIKSSEINEKGLYEVVDQGKQDIAGYNDDNSKLFMKLPIIVYGDHTTFVKYRNSPFIVGADGVKLLSLAINADMKYMYYALDYFNIKPEGYKRHFSIIKKIDLPIPSLNEQKYISSFFSKLDDEINFLKLQIENMKNFKKGLLQKMFV